MFTLHPQLEADTLTLAEFPLCRLLLLNDSHYPWFILVPRQANRKEVFELSPTDQIQYLMESSTLAQALHQEYRPDKLNIASIGNKVPQLHIHHIARFQNDRTWPNPVWGQHPPAAYSDTALTQQINRIKIVLNNSPFIINWLV